MTVTSKVKVCCECANIFEPKHARHTACSAKCRKKSDRRIERQTPAYKMRRASRRKIGKMLGVKSGVQVVDVLGCSSTELKRWIECQFTDGMSWGNYGGCGFDLGRWHVDHKKPLAAFDLTKKSERAKAFHYTNLQPMWALENFTKAAL